MTETLKRGNLEHSDFNPHRLRKRWRTSNNKDATITIFQSASPTEAMTRMAPAISAWCRDFNPHRLRKRWRYWVLIMIPNLLFQSASPTEAMTCYQSHPNYMLQHFNPHRLRKRWPISLHNTSGAHHFNPHRLRKRWPGRDGNFI